MEQEKLLREQEEKQKAEKFKKMKENFGDTSSQWEKDKTEMQNIALQEKKKQGGAAAESKEKSDKPIKAQKEERKETRKEERKEERQPRRGAQQATEDR
jgi:mannan polymerase II complex ANP1 subunit